MRSWKLITLKTLQDDRELLKEFYTDYAKSFETPCPTCQNKLRFYYQKLIKFIPMESTKKCKIKGNRHLHINIGSSIQVYHNGNITDEIAVRLIQENSKLKDLFEVLPDMPKIKKVKKTVKKVDKKTDKKD